MAQYTPTVTFNLQIVDANLVSERCDFGQGRKNKYYNSNFHSEFECPHYVRPLDEPVKYHYWTHLVPGNESIQRVTLSRAQTQLLLECAKISIHTGKISALYAEDINDLIRPAFSQLEFGDRGLFCRFDACSPKDGRDSGRGVGALRNVDQVIMRIVTSIRAIQSMEGILDPVDKDTRKNQEMVVYFLPFRLDMDTTNEFRVFCPPGNRGITAISQYKWYTPSIFSGYTRSQLDPAIEAILQAASSFYRQIIDTDFEYKDLLREQGFTFDISIGVSESVVSAVTLVELNSFGSRSGCGSCLHHWLRDEETLYGSGKGDKIEEVDVKISLEKEARELPERE